MGQVLATRSVIAAADQRIRLKPTPRNAMRDPHIKRLFYAIGSEEDIQYRDPPPSMAFANELGNFEAKDGVLIVEPTEHFASEGDARVVIDPYLRSWEIEADLIFNVGTIRFNFQSAEIIDRNPPPSGHTVLTAGIAQFRITGHPVTLTITRSTYPTPPSFFRTSPEVEAGYRRWRNVGPVGEPLLSMAYWLLTMLEARAGDRKKAATTFRIEPNVLNTLGDLGANRGDLENARKVRVGQQPLTGLERAWVEAAIRRLLRRLGEHASGSPLPQISMNDLPPLRS